MSVVVCIVSFVMIGSGFWEQRIRAPIEHHRVSWWKVRSAHVIGPERPRPTVSFTRISPAVVSLSLSLDSNPNFAWTVFFFYSSQKNHDSQIGFHSETSCTSGSWCWIREGNIQSISCLGQQRKPREKLYEDERQLGLTIRNWNDIF